MSDEEYEYSSLDDLLEEGRNRHYPLWQRAWWRIKRGWESVRMLPRRAKWFVQRGRRGWSDRDTWSLDYYLSEWLPGALRHLKETKQGVPGDMFEGLTAERPNPTEEEMTAAVARWNGIMDKMIAGFEAWQRMQDGLYESEMGEYEMYRPEGVSREEWRAHRDERYAQRRKLEERDQVIFDEGMALFGKYFGALWD